MHPDVHGIVRTVTVGLKGKDRDKPLTYVPRPLDELTIGIQRIAVICPVEEQNEVMGDVDNGVTVDNGVSVDEEN